MLWTGGAVLRPAQHREDYRFEEQQSKAGCDSGNDQAALAHRGEHYEVQRDQQSGERDRGTPGSGVNLASGEEVDRAVRQQQHQQGKQNAAGIETPGKKQSGSEHGDVVESQRGRDLDKESAVDERRRQRQ